MHHNPHTPPTNLKLEPARIRAHAGLAAWLPVFVVLTQLAAPIASEAATVWTGPTINFTNLDGSDPPRLPTRTA